MGFNPFQEKGTPIENQFRNWEELNSAPYLSAEVHPYTRCRVILMNGIEAEGAFFSHNFSRHTDDTEIKRKLALTRRVEQQQQKMINWLIPFTENHLEVTIGYEQVAVDLTAWLARTEPNTYVKAALDFALLEDFDHLYRYANLYELTQGKSADAIVGNLTEIFPGRPTIAEHRHPFDDLRRPYDGKKADIRTKLHVLTITAAEQQTMNFYMNIGNRAETDLARGLYAEIGQIEEQHVSHYESLADPNATWLEMLLLHEYNECYLYYSCLSSEPDERIKNIWQRCLEDEIAHLHSAAELMRQFEGREPEELFPHELPQLTLFQPNKEYVRKIEAAQVDLTARDTDFVPVRELGPDHRFFEYQTSVNGDGFVPSQEVIEENIQTQGRDYRLETEGPHPVERLRAREHVTI